MNKNAKKWVEALRDGTRTQVRSTLTDGTGFCCLGVACEVYLEVYPHSKAARKIQDNHGEYQYGGDCSYLPNVVRNWLGLRTENGLYDSSDSLIETSLASHNDDDEFTFEQIADVIESEPKGLFS